MNFVVTGGSRGIGRGIVLALLEAGHDVAFTYRRNASAAEETRGLADVLHPERRCLAFCLDQRDPVVVEEVGGQILDQLGEVDAVVLNAGVNRDRLAFSMTDEEWREVVDTNLSGSFFITRQFLPSLLASGRGRLIFVGSVAQDGLSGQANYAASKAGLIGLMRTMAKEYGPKGVTANAIVPGFFDTDMTRDTMPQHHKEYWAEFCPAGRMGRVDEVAAAVLFLASEGAGFVNGASLPVTGGLDHAR